MSAIECPECGCRFSFAKSTSTRNYQCVACPGCRETLAVAPQLSHPKEVAESGAAAAVEDNARSQEADLFLLGAVTVYDTVL